MRRPTIRLRYVLVAIWVVFTLSLLSWWLYFGLQQLGRLMMVEHGATAELVRYQKMLFWEGSTLFLVIIVGGGALAYYMYREVRESRRIQQFLSAFTHEIRTPLSSIRLQAEMLRERLTNDTNSDLLDRFVGETERLALQLENSLFLVSFRERRWFHERVSLESVIAEIKAQFPNLSIKLEGGGTLKVDARALKCIFSNIFQNSIIHGAARNIAILAKNQGNSVHIKVRDDGQGFSGDRKKLGELFTRHYSGSGSGLGLFLVRSLTREMGGRCSIPLCDSGFEIELIFPGAPL